MTALVPTEMRSLGGVLARLGGVPLERVWMRGPLGEETEGGWLEASRHGRFELVDGVLVEKAKMGWEQSWLGKLLGFEVGGFVLRYRLGVVLGGDGPLRIEGQVRLPDIAFIPWERVPPAGAPYTAILEATPDLAVEVISPSNTAAEMARKRRECFAAGTRLVWEVEPELRVVRVYTDADAFTVLTASDELTGEPALPGFRLSLRELFDGRRIGHDEGGRPMAAMMAAEMRSLGGVLARLGGVPVERVWMRGPLGEETEGGWLEASRHGKFELVDGVLVEKTMGVFETRVGIVLTTCLEIFLTGRDMGFILAETGATRIEGQIRMPDVAFFSWVHFPDRRVPRVAALDVAPDLAVEVMSPSNTAAEMARKRRECFDAGTRLVWEVEPELRIVRVYTDADAFAVLTASDELTGEPALPGFRLGVQALFDRAEGRA